jgi:hypothetical protein
MIKPTLTLAILPVAFATHAACLMDQPEMGDIGPSSQLVCTELERLFPGAALAVEGRAIHSPTVVSLYTSVNGKPLELRYDLSGYRWRLDRTGVGVGDVPALGDDVAMDK